MRRRDFLATSAVGLASLGHALAVPEGRPNLLFIMTDQQRHDALSIAGHSVLQTPNLDRLACEGAWFERAYTQCAVCAPARATILTGVTVVHHGVHSNGLAYVEEESGVCPMKTFDELLSERGYHCEYHGKWHMPIHRARCYREFAVERKPKGRYQLQHFLDYRAQLGSHVPRRELRHGEQMSEYGHPYTVDPMDRWYGLPPGQDPRKPGIRLEVGKSKTWKQAVFDVSDARFAHRQNGRDIRVQVHGDRDLTFGGLTVQAITPLTVSPGPRSVPE